MYAIICLACKGVGKRSEGSVPDAPRVVPPEPDGTIPDPDAVERTAFAATLAAISPPVRFEIERLSQLPALLRSPE